MQANGKTTKVKRKVNHTLLRRKDNTWQSGASDSNNTWELPSNVPNSILSAFERTVTEPNTPRSHRQVLQRLKRLYMSRLLHFKYMACKNHHICRYIISTMLCCQWHVSVLFKLGMAYSWMERIYHSESWQYNEHSL
jgi:hypothetical protein